MNTDETSPVLSDRLHGDLAVLLVNDDPGALFALRTVLGELDAPIVTAASGEQALLRLLKQDFCVIVMDVKMAGLDGFATARLIRSRPRSHGTPIIFLTSHRATDLDRSEGYELGAADYLFMPVAPEVLKAKVRTFIDSAKTSGRRHQGDIERTSLSPAPGRDIEHAAANSTHQYAGNAAPERLILEHAGDYVVLLDAQGICLYASPSYQREFGAVVRPGVSYLEIVHADDRERIRSAIARAPEDHANWRLQYRVIGRKERILESDVNPILAPSGAVEQLVVVSRDITERKEMEAFVLHQSFHDNLTGLPNRLLLLDRMGQAMSSREHPRPQIAVLFMDLDHFKAVNDSLGHAAGDRLLQDVAERLTACVREHDTVARVGGDEFVVLLVDLHQLADAVLVANKIISVISAGCQIEGSELHVTPSIGLALFPEDGETPDTLLRNADVAMYQAKRDGGARYSFFAPQLQEAASRRLALSPSCRSSRSRRRQCWRIGPGAWRRAHPITHQSRLTRSNS